MTQKTKDDLQKEYQAEIDAGETRLTYNEWCARRIMEESRNKASKRHKAVVSQKAAKAKDKPDSAPPVEDKPAPKDKKKKKSAAELNAAGTVEPSANRPMTPEEQAKFAATGKGDLPEAPVRITTDEAPLPPAPEKLDDTIVRSSGLTERQEMFCWHYVGDAKRNGTEAARLAGYSATSAHVAASRLLRNDKVRAYIDALTAPHLAKLEITQERILEEYKAMAFVNNHDFVQKDEAGQVRTDDNGLPIPDFTGITRQQMAGLAGMKITILPAFGEDEPNPIKVEWKLQDKKAALDVLAKRAGVLKETVEHSGEIKITGNTPELAKRLAFMLRQAASRDKTDKK